MLALPQGEAIAPTSRSDAGTASVAATSAETAAMKRLMEVIVYGIPERFHVDCAACLFWRGAAFGAAVCAVIGTVVLHLAD